MWMLDANKQGNYTLPIKVKNDGDIKVNSKEDGVYDPDTNFKEKPIMSLREKF